jgi:hypothetical protein
MWENQVISILVFTMAEERDSEIGGRFGTDPPGDALQFSIAQFVLI